MDEQKDELGERKILANFSFLTSLLDRAYGAMEQARTDMMGMQNQLSRNLDLTMEFIGQKELSSDWEEFIQKKQDEAQQKIDEDNDPNYKIKQELAEAEAEAESEESEDDKTED